MTATKATAGAAAARSRGRSKAGRRRLPEAFREALTRWAVATAAIAAIAIVGEVDMAGAQDPAPGSAPIPAPSPRGPAAEYEVGGFDPIEAWDESPRRIAARPTISPRRAAVETAAGEAVQNADAAEMGVSSFSVAPGADADTEAEATATPDEPPVEELAEEPTETATDEPPAAEPTETAADEAAPDQSPAPTADDVPAQDVAEDVAEDVADADAPVAPAPAPRPETLITAPPSAGGARAEALLGGDGAESSLPASPRSGAVGYMVVRVDDRAVMAARNADDAFIPASVAKVPTALYAIEALGYDFRFRTRLVATGPIENGALRGDLILLGGGDPTLDTADVESLVATLKAAGVDRVEGRFLYDDNVLPSMAEIEPGQPIYAAYNPGVSGLSLNFNRVLFRWERQSAGVYSVELRAHAAGRWVLAAGHQWAMLEPEDRALFRLSATPSGAGAPPTVVWSVSERNLGRRGQRWLPVKDPSYYAALTFQTVAAEDGVTLPAPTRGAAPRLSTAPDGPRVIAEHRSRPLSDILEGMMKFSTNITAEAVGLTATAVRQLAGGGLGQVGADPSRSLDASGAAMADWINESFGLVGDGAGAPTIFYNHSGLTAASRMTPRAMTQILVNAANGDAAAFEAFYELLPVRRGRGVRNSAIVRAKTGTIYYGRALAGYIECKATGELYAFAFFNSDPAERASFDLTIDVHAPAAPRSASVWLNRAVSVERQLITRWTQRFCG